MRASVRTLAPMAQYVANALKGERDILSCVDQWTKALRHVSVKATLISPLISPIDKKNILQELGTALKGPVLLTRILTLLTAYNLASLLISFLQDLHKRLVLLGDKIEIKVCAAQPLSQETQTRITGWAQKLTQKKVSLVIQEDKELLAGLQIMWQDKFVDMSFANQLTRLIDQLRITHL